MDLAPVCNSEVELTVAPPSLILNKIMRCLQTLTYICLLNLLSELEHKCCSILDTKQDKETLTDIYLSVQGNQVADNMDCAICQGVGKLLCNLFVLILIIFKLL